METFVKSFYIIFHIYLCGNCDDLCLLPLLKFNIVLKMVNRKPICRPKDTNTVRFRFLQIKTCFLTYSLFMSLPKYSTTTTNISHVYYDVLSTFETFCPQKVSKFTSRFIFIRELHLMYTFGNLCLGIY